MAVAVYDPGNHSDMVSNLGGGQEETKKKDTKEGERTLLGSKHT